METTSVLAKLVVPKVPLLTKTAVLHTLHLGDTPRTWDLQTALTVTFIRSFFDNPKNPLPLSKLQRASLKDFGIRPKQIISRVNLPRPHEDSVRQVLFRAIDAMKDEGEIYEGKIYESEPDLLGLTAEWTGYRQKPKHNVHTHHNPETGDSYDDKVERARYDEMMGTLKNKITVLYIHGGAMYLMDPCTHRITTAKLAKLTGGRVLSIRYRLAPQGHFPAALLDCLVAYMNLLYPLPGAYHEPVDPGHIVISGDSAGGNLAASLLQLILQIRRMDAKITWNGEEREVPVPAGVACNSGWFDITHSFPSTDKNVKFDYLPPVQRAGVPYPDCPIWPTKPARKHIYAETAALCHPLVSPVLAKSWEGAPPMWVEVGEELLTDEGKFMAEKLAKQGVKVVFEEYMSMPHCFAMLGPGIQGGRKCYDSWSKFIKACVEDPASIVTKATRIEAKTLEEVKLDPTMLSKFNEADVRKMMRGSVDTFVRGGDVQNIMSKL